MLLLPQEASGEAKNTVARLVLPRLIWGWDSLPAPVLDSLFTGLEALAIRHENPAVRHSAIGLIGQAGIGANPMPGVVARLEHVYHEAGDHDTRFYIVHGMPRQREQNAAALFLRRVVLEDPSRDPKPGELRQTQEWALESLRTLGPAGSNVLRDLHMSGQVRDPEVRHRLRQILEERAGRGIIAGRGRFIASAEASHDFACPRSPFSPESDADPVRKRGTEPEAVRTPPRAGVAGCTRLVHPRVQPSVEAVVMSTPDAEALLAGRRAAALAEVRPAGDQIGSTSR